MKYNYSLRTDNYWYDIGLYRNKSFTLFNILIYQNRKAAWTHNTQYIIYFYLQICYFVINIGRKKNE